MITRDVLPVRPELARVSVRAAYDEIAASYDAVHTAPSDLAENGCVFSLFRRSFPDYEWLNVLELGCGSGFVLDHLDIGPGRYLGIDLSPRMLDVARSKYPQHCFQVSDMADLRLCRPDGVDLVVSTFSFPYCLEPERAVAEVERVLVPGGRFFIMAYGHRYHWRRSHVTPDVLFWTCSATALRRLFGAFEGVQVQGAWGGVGYLSRLIPQRALNKLVLWEAQTVGRWVPLLCYLLIATGEKGAR